MNCWLSIPGQSYFFYFFFKLLLNCQVFSRIITNKITRIFLFSPSAKRCQKYLFHFFLWLSKNTRYASTYLYTKQFTLILFNSIKIYIDSDWIQTHASIQQALKSKTEIDLIKKYYQEGNWISLSWSTRQSIIHFHLDLIWHHSVLGNIPQESLKIKKYWGKIGDKEKPVIEPTIKYW